MDNHQEPNPDAVADPHDERTSASLEHHPKSKFQALLAHLKIGSARPQGSQLSRNMSAGSTMAFVGSIVSVISYPVYLHYLGYHRYGLWLVLSVVVSVAQLGNLGIPWALMKLVAEEHSRGDWEGVKTYINLGCGILLATGMIFVLAITALRQNIVHWFKLTGSDAATVYAMLPYVALLSLVVFLFSTFNAALGGLGRIDITSYHETLSQILTLVFPGVLLYMHLDLWGMLLGTLAGYAATQALSFAQVQRRMPIRLIARTRLDRHKLRQLLGTGGWILSGGAFSVLFLPFTRMMLSRFAGLEAVAVNDMCLTGSMRVRNIFDAAFRPMMPELSSLQGKGQAALLVRMRSIDRKGFKVILLAAVPTVAVLMIAMNPLLHLWLHRSFNPLLPSTFRIALLGALGSLLGSSAYYMLIGIGSARDSAIASAIQFAANATALLAVAYVTNHITVGEAAMAFGVGTTCATIFLRIRIHILVRSKNALRHLIALRESATNS